MGLCLVSCWKRTLGICIKAEQSARKSRVLPGPPLTSCSTADKKRGAGVCKMGRRTPNLQSCEN